MQEILAIMSLIFLLGAAKKTEPRWIQLTLTGGAPKGAVDWLKPNTKIEPSMIRVGSAQDFENDGFKIPDFLSEKMEQTVIIVIEGNDPQRRPLLIHQMTAIVPTLIWMKSITFSEDFSHKTIETIHTDEPWELNYRRGSKKFDPYTMSAQDLSDGPGGAV